MKRVYPRFTPDDYERIRYWASQRGVSEGEFVREATLDYLRHINGDYDIPRFEQQRLNQLVAAVSELVATNKVMTDTISDGFNSLFGLTRGDNYLLDDSEDM